MMPPFSLFPFPFCLFDHLPVRPETTSQQQQQQFLCSLSPPRSLAPGWIGFLPLISFSFGKQDDTDKGRDFFLVLLCRTTLIYIFGLFFLGRLVLGLGVSRDQQPETREEQRECCWSVDPKKINKDRSKMKKKLALSSKMIFIKERIHSGRRRAR